jgi:hypothetical protein
MLVFYAIRLEVNLAGALGTAQVLIVDDGGRV